MEYGRSGIYRSSLLQVFFKIGVLKNFTTFKEKHLCWSLFLIKLQAWRPTLYQKEILTQVFSYKYCKIVKNSFLYRTPLMAASGFLTKLAENNFEENHSLIKFFSEISQKLFLSLCYSVSKNNYFKRFFAVFVFL